MPAVAAWAQGLGATEVAAHIAVEVRDATEADTAAEGSGAIGAETHFAVAEPDAIVVGIGVQGPGATVVDTAVGELDATEADIEAKVSDVIAVRSAPPAPAGACQGGWPGRHLRCSVPPEVHLCCQQAVCCC